MFLDVNGMTSDLKSFFFLRNCRTRGSRGHDIRKRLILPYTTRRTEQRVYESSSIYEEQDGWDFPAQTGDGKLSTSGNAPVRKPRAYQMI